MSITHSVTCDIPRRPAPLVTFRPSVCRPMHPGLRAGFLPATSRAPSLYTDPAVGWQVREEPGEYDIPDPSANESFEPDPDLLDAAEAYTEEQRESMALLDEADNLLAVLLAAIEDDGDSRAMQAVAVLEVVRKKLLEAHERIDRQDTRQRDLFLAYFDLKSRSEREAE